MMSVSLRISVLLAASLVVSGCSGGKKGSAKPDDGTTHVKTGCDRFYYQGREPVVVKASMAKGLKPLCYRAFSLGYSPVSKTAMWSAERIDSTTVSMARKMERHDEFHPEPRLAPPAGTKLKDSPRAELADYRGSGYDRGHLAPSGDMPTRDSQAESFTLANMIPQAPKLNRGSWSELESDVRDQTYDVKQIYVVTGPVFNGKNVLVINDRIMIPSHVWKAILIPGRGASVYLASNTNYPVWKTMSVSQFVKFSGINPFPAIDPKMAEANMALGETSDKKKRRGKGRRGSNEVRGPYQAWDPQNCNAPWRPQEDPHYRHCHTVLESEAKYGLVPGTTGNRKEQMSKSRSQRQADNARSGETEAWSKKPKQDPAERLRARNRDRARDGE